MHQPISDLDKLLASLCPALNDGVYVYSSVPPDTDLGDALPIATFREREGVTLIVEEEAARRANLPVLFRAAWITLTVHSDLEAVGLTAAFAQALGSAGISCNVVAAVCHDHIFVPVERANDAMIELMRLQSDAQRRDATRGAQPD